MNHTIKISVRDLVEFVSRGGDIDSEYTGRDRANIGTTIHTKVQKRRIKEGKLNGFVYEKEFHLKYSFPYKDFTFEIQGRADGIIIREDEVSVEEIKSTYINLDEILFDENHWHLSQAKCYGFMYCKLYDVPRIKILLTYHNINHDENITFETTYTIEELEKFINTILKKYYVFANYDYKRVMLRNETLSKLDFPFDNYRKNQYDLAKVVYKTICLERKLFFEAPTGTGKTVSTIFPSIKAIETGKVEKIFYLTGKTITRKVAEDAFNLMTEKGLRMRVIILTAKDKICLNDKVSCNPKDCHYANGHFDRINTGLLDILEKEFIINREIVLEYSKKHNLCPFEFSFDISNFCDCIVCDYNHVYDPKVYMKRYFEAGKKNDFVLLNDESHNLLDRSKDMYSAELSLKNFSSLQKDLEHYKKIHNCITKIIMFYENIETFYLSIENISIEKNYNNDFIFLLMDFNRVCDKWLVENKNNLFYEDVISLYFKVNDFLRIIDFYDDRFVYYMEKSNHDITFKLLCLDSSYVLSQILKRVKSSIFFSATLSPIKFYNDSLGGDDEDFNIILPSSFDEKNMKLILDKSISTKYIHRENSYLPIAERLYTLVNSKIGNYIVYFPSYIYLEKVYKEFENLYKHIKTIVQDRDLTEQERENFLKHFKPNPKKTLLGFCVLGGMFSEGIDLVKDMLIGVCIVSVGLPLINPERSVMMDYYNEMGLNGFDYAYKFPGMNKIFQAGGRVIRTDDDKGIIYLIDQRFTYTNYNYLFPYHWRDFSVINNNDSLKSEIDKFWNKFD